MSGCVSQGKPWRPKAANRIPPDFRDNNPEIEWKRIRGFRNRIIHDYFGVDYEIVWEIIETYLDELIDWLVTIIDNNKTLWTKSTIVGYFRMKFGYFIIH